jgi:integration host factor subunit beta
MDSGSAMLRSGLIQALADQFPHIEYRQVDVVVRGILDHLAETVAKGERIEIRGFGSFCLHALPARTGRNPKTGEPVEIPGKYSVHFKPGKELKELANGSGNPLPLDGQPD